MAKTPDIDLSPLNDRQFESLVFDLLAAEGFSNLDWIDGGADGGRDIEAYTIDHDASGHEERHRWSCDAKLYQSRGIPFDKIHPTLARAAARGPDFLLLAVHPYLTPPCKDDLARWIDSTKPQFKVRVWEQKQIEERLYKHPDILRTHLPNAWSEQLQMDAYLREAASVLRGFRDRVPIIWKNPDQRPFSELLRIVPRDKRSNVGIYDYSQRLTDSERVFLRSLIDANGHLAALLEKAFNMPERTAFIIGKWDEHPDDTLIVPMFHRLIVREDIKKGIQRALHDVEKEYAIRSANGILAAVSAWKPFGEKNQVALYVLCAQPNVEETRTNETTPTMPAG